MSTEAPIVPPKARKRHFVGRPKALLCAAVSLAAAVASGAIFLDRAPGDSWMPVLACGGVAVVAAILALLFRLTERPRQIDVTDFWDGEPPVVHLKTGHAND